MGAVIAVGALVALGTWCLLTTATSRAVALGDLGGSAPGAPDDVRDDAGPADVVGGAGPRRAVPRHDAEGAAVRVAVSQVVAVLGTGVAPSQAWPRALGVTTGRDGVPERAALAARLGDARAACAVVAAARLSREVGAPLGGVLDVVGAALVARQEADADREASLAGPHATARVLVWLPALGVLLAAALGARPWVTATDGGIGTAVVLAGVAMLCVGRWWSGRLVAAARRAGDAS